MQIVEVKWLDSIMLQDGWASISEYREKSTKEHREHFSCGYLVQNTNDGILLALSAMKPPDDEIYVTDCMWIPRAAIVEMHELQPFFKAPSAWQE
jgi:hypothetical protein